MSQAPEGKEQPPTSGPASIDRRAWSRERQLRAVGIAAAGALLVVLVFWLGGRFFGKHEAAIGEAPSPPGTFRATAQQMKTFTIEPVGVHGFVSEELTEGKIAVNGDRATPLYLPLFGPGHPRDRGSRRYGEKGRAARDDRGHRSSSRRKTISLRPPPQLKLARINESSQACAVRGQGRQPARLAASRRRISPRRRPPCIRCAIG